jgi:hypothetical protein
VNLGSTVNTPAYEYCCYLTPDRRFFFFSSEGDIKWMSAEALLALIEKLPACRRLTPNEPVSKARR